MPSFGRIHWLVGMMLVSYVGFMSPIARADDWPQWLGPQRDGVWRESGILDKFPPSGPKVLWRVSIGAGYSGPAVANGRVFVTDRLLKRGSNNPTNPFDRNTEVPGSERVLCLDQKTGKILWTHEYPCVYRVSYASGPRATPIVEGDRVWTLGTMGDLLCLNVQNGAVIWSKQFVKDYDALIPVWGFAAHPLIDGDQLICLVGGNKGLVMAFDKNTGKELWSRLQANEPGYCPPMIYMVGGMRQLIIWHPQAVVGLEPGTGKKLWEVPFEVRAGLSIPTPRLDGDKLFVTSFYNGPILLQLASNPPSARIVWKGKSNSEQPNRTDGLHAIMTTPVIRDGYIYGVCSYGELRCLKEATGERIWSTYQATTGKSTRWGHAFLIPQGDRFFIFNELGELIIAQLTPEKYHEIDRAKILQPDNKMAGRPVVWMHPAFAGKCMFARNDHEIVCVSLAKE